MDSRILANLRGAIVLGLLAIFARPASAQVAARPDVELTPVEVAFGLSINALAQDINAAPNCLQMSLPCTNQRPSQVGGFGLDLGIVRNLSPHFGIVTDLSAFANEWDSGDSVRAHRRESSTIKSAFIGHRFSTEFFYPSSRDPTPGRMFGQVLVGAAGSDDVPMRLAWQVGVGADVLVPRGGPYGVARAPTIDLALRMAIDYRLCPGGGRNVSGWLFVLGFVVGPHLK